MQKPARSEVEDTLILLAKTGSTLYGTDTPESDLDLQGVFIGSYSSYFYKEGECHQVTELWKEPSSRPATDPVNTLLSTCRDATIYEVRSILNLLTKANPNKLELLFLKEDDIIEVNAPIWDFILERKKFFINSNIQKTYCMYAYSQLKRVETHRKWLLSPVEAPKPEEYGLELGVMKRDEVEAFFRLLHLLIKDRVEYLNVIDDVNHLFKEKIDLFDLVRNAPDSEGLDSFILGVTLPFPNALEAYKSAKAFYKARQEYQSFVSWETNRNPKRHAIEKKCGYDGKHLGHCLRLLYQGLELIETGDLEINISTKPYFPYIQKVINGKIPYPKVMETAQDLFTLFKSLNVSHLPPPNLLLRTELLEVIHANL
jgi:hypothetical protein